MAINLFYVLVQVPHQKPHNLFNPAFVSFIPLVAQTDKFNDPYVGFQNDLHPG